MEYNVNNFQYCFGFSESKFVEFSKSEKSLDLTIYGVDILINKKDKKLFVGDFNYDQYLNIKYSSEISELAHIFCPFNITFKIEDYSIFYDGYDDIFTSLLFDFSPDNNIDRDFSFSFGFAFDNVYDEFEICSDSQVIEVIFDEKLLLDAIENPKPISINPKSLELLKKRNKLKKK